MSSLLPCNELVYCYNTNTATLHAAFVHPAKTHLWLVSGLTVEQVDLRNGACIVVETEYVLWNTPWWTASLVVFVSYDAVTDILYVVKENDVFVLYKASSSEFKDAVITQSMSSVCSVKCGKAGTVLTKEDGSQWLLRAEDLHACKTILRSYPVMTATEDRQLVTSFGDRSHHGSTLVDVILLNGDPKPVEVLETIDWHTPGWRWLIASRVVLLVCDIDVSSSPVMHAVCKKPLWEPWLFVLLAKYAGFNK